MSVRPMSEGVCPACLHPISRPQPGYTCLCGLEVPALLLQEYQDSSPLVIQLLGWSGHGKTSYLTALGFVLSRLGSVWPAYTLRGGTPETQQQLTAAFRLVREGRMPDKTAVPGAPAATGATGPVAVPQHTYLLRNLPEWGHRVVMFHDQAGQLCDGMTLPTEQLPFLRRAPVSLMILSADDLDKDDYRTMDMLLTSFVHTLQSDGGQGPGQRGVVVVLSKADLHLGRLPPEIHHYLVSDPLWPLLLDGSGGAASARVAAALDELEDVRLYLEEMYRIESRLREWLVEEPPLRTLQLEGKRHGIELRFSVVSATGEEVRGHAPISGSWRPHRVLDPLFWAFELTSGREGVLPLWQRSTRGSSSPEAAPGGDVAEGKYSLLIRDRRHFGVERKVNLERKSGDLGKVMPELRELTFTWDTSGVRFRLASSDAPLFLHHAGGVERLSSSEVLLRPRESISTDDWQLELRSGHFTPRGPGS